MRFHPALGLLAALAVTSAATATEISPAKLEFFEKKVRPILKDHCHACHAAETKPAGGLRVDDHKGLLTGGNTGPAILSGKPAESLLIKRISKDAKRRMPSEGDPLTEEQVAILTKWVADGAVWPPISVPPTLGKPKVAYEQLKKEHWAWQPLTNPKVPQVKDPSWAKSDIDRFLLAKLEAAGIQPVSDATKGALIRRITLDLTGLPPTPEQIESFIQDSSPNAYEALVDRLLASAAFGEKWGRQWLDVARYGESTGPSRNIPYPHAWKYRDYVIDAVNSDVPFNRFIQEQVAGDLLTPKNDEDSNRLKIATGFLALGVKDVNQRFKTRFTMDNVDEQIDVVTRSVLGLTASCARCHDHKFDPIPQTDYYGLAGIFTSTENAAGVRNLMGGGGLAYYVPDQLVRLEGKLPPADPKVVAKLTKDVAEAKAKWDAIRGTPEGLKPGPNGQPTQRPIRLKFERLQNELLSLTDPAQRGQAAHGVRDAKVVGDTEIRIRGEAEKLGPVWPRGYLTAFNVPDAKPINPKQSGRLELAQWLTSDKNPLTARVYANRVWHNIFGRGIVSTVDNFGVNGDAPTNPDLLDHLANKLIQEGWSTKKLVRSLVLTRAYQLSSESREENYKLDPANKLVWRHNPRRLSAEEFRDGVLSSSGQLNTNRPEGSPTNKLKMIEIRDNGPEANGIHETADKSLFRSVYLPLMRGLTPRALEAFDPVEQTLVTGSRDTTTVPGQALFLLNSTFIRRQSLALAEKVLKETHTSEAEKIREVYLLTIGRTPSETEIIRAGKFLSEYESDAREEVALVQKTIANPAKPELKKPKKADEPPLDPDQIDQTAEAVTEEIVVPKDARTAAWLAFVQAQFGSAEFRFVK